MNGSVKFEEILPDTYQLRVPFGSVWTGVVLVLGRKNRGVNVLIDSSHLEPEQYLLPALADLGLQPSDIDWLLNTHVHGDHIGGHHTLVTKYGLKTCTLDSAADALRDPVKVAIRVRTRFPKNSPAPQSYLKGVEPDKVVKEGELLEGRFTVLTTPGHDDDCLTWIDTKTGTAFTGDSLQANGTPTQGIGFYRSLPAYRATLAKLKGMCQGEDALPTGKAARHVVQGEDALPTGESDKPSGQGVPALAIQNIVCGHDYDGIGSVIKGRAAVAQALAYSADRVKLYEEKLRSYCCQGEDALATGKAARHVVQGEDALPTGESDRPSGQGVPALASENEEVLVPLALRLIDEVGCGRPEALFLALHTVSEHLKEVRSVE